MICIQISERDLAQKLNFSCRQQNFFIYTDDITVVDIHDTQSEELLVWTFFNDFAQMLQLAVVAQLSLVADFLDFRNNQSLILNNDNDEAQIHWLIEKWERKKRRYCQNNSHKDDDLWTQRVTSQCRDILDFDEWNC